MITRRRMLDRWKQAVAVDPADAVLALIVDPERARDIPLPTGGDFAAVEIANALACSGVEVPAIAASLPATPRGALAALAAGDVAAAAALLPGDAAKPRVDDVAATVRYLIGVVRDHGDIHVAFAAWHAMVASVAAGLAEPSTLLWVARIVVHQIGDKPLGSIARWVHDTLEREAVLQEHALSDDRERARIELLDDPVRVTRQPDVRLRAWEASAVRIDQLLEQPLDQLGHALARSVLVDPDQPPSAPAIVDRLLAADPRSPDERLGIIDAANALEAIGVVLPATLLARIAGWLPVLLVGPPLAKRLRACLALLAHGELDRAATLAPERPGTFVAGLAFPNDLLAVTGYAISAVRARAVAATLDRALGQVAEDLEALCACEQLDEPTALWIARVASHVLDERPVAEVAKHAHAWLWHRANDLDQARREAATRTRTFPLDRTLGDGAYKIDRWLQGTGAQRLYAGIETATGGRLLIAFDDHSPRQDLAELRTAISYRGQGLFDLVDVGTLDGDRDHHAIVERVPEGEWLPHVLGPADPWTAARAAVALALSAGHIVQRATERGVVLSGIRPELMWAQRRGELLAVTGLSTRAIELFRRSRADARTHAVFESDDLGPATVALAAMIADRAGNEAPSALRAVLARAHEQSLAAFLDELARL